VDEDEEGMSWTLDEGVSIVPMAALTFLAPHHELSSPLLHVQ
jgi:hypothetical protein